MVEDMMVNGNKIICMERELTHGKMEENILVIMLMTKSMDMENILGLMVVGISVNGTMENSMEKEGICYLTVLRE